MLNRREWLLAAGAASAVSAMNGWVPGLARAVGAEVASAPSGGVDASVALGGETHLFFDDMLIAEKSGVAFAVNPPRLRQRVITFDEAWENPGEYSSVIQGHDGTYRMYYLSTRDGMPFVCLATSNDGVKWDKPKLGLHEYRGSKENNITIWGCGTGTAYYDEHEPDPERKYKYFGCQIGDDKPGTRTAEGMVLYTSPDGIRWTKLEVQLLPFNADSQAILFRDRYSGKYVCYMRGNHGDVPGSRGRKVVRGETSDPYTPWPYKASANPFWHDHELAYVTTELPTALTSDEADPVETDLYGSQVFPYPWARRAYLAFPTVYYHYKEDRVHLSPDGKGGNQGVGEVQLAVSRDGVSWTRYRRPPYIKCGWYGQSYVGWPWMLQGMFRRPDGAIYQYVSLRRTAHGGQELVKSPRHDYDGFTLFEQPPDRFVAAESAYGGGTIVTQPIVFDGDRLVLNLDTSATGEMRVGVLNADGTPWEGYGVRDCDLINCDAFGRVVTWRGKADCAGLSGKKVRLRFETRGTKLYAMRIGKGDAS